MGRGLYVPFRIASCLVVKVHGHLISCPKNGFLKLVLYSWYFKNKIKINLRVVLGTLAKRAVSTVCFSSMKWSFTVKTPNRKRALRRFRQLAGCCREPEGREWDRQ